MSSRTAGVLVRMPTRTPCAIPVRAAVQRRRSSFCRQELVLFCRSRFAASPWTRMRMYRGAILPSPADRHPAGRGRLPRGIAMGGAGAKRLGFSPRRLPAALGLGRRLLLLLAVFGLALALRLLGLGAAARGLGRLRLGLLLGLGLLALLVLLLGLVLRAEQLDDGHLRPVAPPRAQAQDARVPARTRSVAGAEVVEQLLHHREVVDLPRHQPPRVQPVVVALGLGDELLGVGPQLLGLHERGADAFALEEGGRQIAQQRRAMGRDAPELTKADLMPHTFRGDPARPRRCGRARVLLLTSVAS